MVYVHQSPCRHYFLPSVEFARSDIQCGQRAYDNHSTRAHGDVALKELERVGHALQSHFCVLDPVHVNSVDNKIFDARPFALRDEQ